MRTEIQKPISPWFDVAVRTLLRKGRARDRHLKRCIEVKFIRSEFAKELGKDIDLSPEEALDLIETLQRAVQEVQQHDAKVEELRARAKNRS